MTTETSKTETEMTFDPNAVDQIDQSTVESTGPSYPTIQWHYGDQKLKKAGGMDYLGGFFIPEDAVDAELLEAAGWERTTWSHQDGSETPGFWRRELAVSVVAYRRRWEVYEGDKRKAFAWNDYDKAKESGRASSRTHVLVLVKGLESQGAFVLTLKGMSAMTFEGTRGSAGVLTEFAKTVIAAANAASDAAARKAGQKAGKRWPFRAFWLPVGVARDAKGEPVFTQAGSGKEARHVVLPQALGLPKKAEEVNLSRYYVGGDLLTTVNDLFVEAEANWAHAWDALTPGADPAGEAAPANGNGHTPEPAVKADPADEKLLETLGL